MAGIVLAVDAGGTTVRMGLFRCSEGRLGLHQLTRFASAGWSNFERDLRGFLAHPEARAVLETARGRAAVFALAGPTDRGTGRGSVTRWGPTVFREVESLLDPLPFDHCILLNDMEAANHAVFHASWESFRPLDGNESPPPRTRFVHMRPGTGLGVGAFSDGRSFPSEGGGAACAFDGSDPDELAVAEHLRPLSGDALPPYEAVLCGDGLRAMSEALTGEAVAPEVLTGGWGKSATSGRVARLFVRLLARAAQGVALTLLPEACFFSGSIVEGFPGGAWETLCGLFRSHPTQGPALSRIRLALIHESELPLHGAALAGARALGLEVR